MDLRTGIPLWRAAGSPLRDFPTLENEVSCEVAIVGGGVTGMLAAFFLARSGVDAIIVDKREFGTGSTVSSTGLLQYEIDTPLAELIDKVGEAHAVRAYRRGVEAIDEFEQLVSELADSCGFVRRSSLYFASDRDDLRGLEREYECRREHGFDVRFITSSELAVLSSIRSPGAIISVGDGQIDPYRLTRCLLDRAREHGLRAYQKTCVNRIVRSGQRPILLTDRGRIAADAVIFAAGYESPDFLSPKVGTLHSTYALASEPETCFDGWPDGCLIWETARPYFYARQTDDGRAIIGGEDTDYSEDHAEPGVLEEKSGRLLARFAQLFPRIEFRPAFAWAGTFGETKDGLAYIGNPPGRDREYFALGYGGNGITFGLIAAKLLLDLWQGRPNEDAAVFRFGR